METSNPIEGISGKLFNIVFYMESKMFDSDVKQIKAECKVNAQDQLRALECFWRSVKDGNGGDLSKYKVININDIQK